MGFLQDHIYPKLPVALQNASLSAFGYAWHKRRFGGIFMQELAGFKHREQFDSTQWRDFQTVQLRKLLVHAYTQVPYYAAAFSKAGFTRSALEKFEIEHLSKLPVLQKETLRQKGTTDLLAANREAGGTFYSSSGSTGTPTRILYSHKMHQRLSALYEARVRNWAGVTKDDSRGMIGGRRVVPAANSQPPFYRYNAIERQVYLSAYHIAPHTAASYVNGLKQFNVNYMVGYAMSNFLLAKFIKEAGLQAPAMKAVLTSSEQLTPSMRTLLSKVYQCGVYDAWSGVEWCGLISENEHQQLLISPDSAYIEILKPDGTHAQPGEEGELVCTGFLNFDQPLIRYKIGDVVKLASNQQTKCGRQFTVVEEIVGRSEDIVTGKDGRQMVRFHGLFVDMKNVIKAQVVQESLDAFTLNIATDGLTNEERRIITSRMQSQLGDVSVTIKEVQNIAPGANGKFKAVISKVKQNAA